MDISKVIKEAYPDIPDNIFFNIIILQDDSDGKGAYIAKWEYSKPIPDGLKLGK